MNAWFDIDKVRGETLGCRRVKHFNNAGASLPPDPVVDSVMRHLELEREVGGYEAAGLAQEKLDHFYDALAQLLNCSSQEIAFVENATRAWDMAFYSIPFEKGDRVLTAQAEYASNYLAYLHMARRRGVVVEVIPSDETGQVSIAALEEMLDHRVRLISITHVPTQGGLVNPAAQVGQVAKKHGCLFLLDACQSVGQMPLDVTELGCHFLSGTGRKYLRGPRGTGFLYVSADVLPSLDPPFIDLHAACWTTDQSYEWRPDARRFENWECYVAGKIGLATAVDYALGLGLEAIEQRICSLAEDLRSRLSGLGGVVLRDQGLHQCGIVSFTKEGQPGARIKSHLAAQGINVSVSEAPSSRLDLRARHLDEVVRASVHYYNNREEIAALCYALSELRP